MELKKDSRKVLIAVDMFIIIPHCPEILESRTIATQSIVLYPKLQWWFRSKHASVLEWSRQCPDLNTTKN